MTLYPPIVHPSLSSLAPNSQLGNMNPPMSSHFGSCSLFLPPVPDPALSAGLRCSSPFILSTQVPSDISLSCDTRWPGSRCPSFVQSSPHLTNTMPSIPVQREAPTQLPFQAADPSLSLLANGPVVDHQPHDSLFPYSQHPPFPCNGFEADLKEKQRPRPSNAFILFRSDFLKRKLISKGQETRQHKLSIIAAKCWNKLTREEKKKWFLQAEREKKAHALKYADYQSPPRARARPKRESRIMASHRELEHLGRLADIAYQEIINDIPSQLARESATSLPTSTTTALTSRSPTLPPRVRGIDLSTPDCYQEQEQLSLPPSYQPLRTVSASDFSSFQNVGAVSHCYASFHCPVHFLQSMDGFSRLVLLVHILQQWFDLRLPRYARLRVAFPRQLHNR